MSDTRVTWHPMLHDTPEWILELTLEEFMERFPERWKPERDWAICVRFYAGEPLASIAADYGITANQVGNIAHEIGMPRRKQGCRALVSSP